MFLDLNEHVAIARRTAVGTSIAFPLNTQSNAAVDARGNANFKRYFLRRQSGSATIEARLLDNGSASPALRTRRLDRKDARRLLNAPATAAVFAHFRLRARLRAAAAARLANFVPTEFNFFGDALGGFVKIKRDAASNVRALTHAGGTPSAPEEVAEKIPERAENIANVLERRPRPVAIKSGFPVTVVDFLLFRIFKNFKRFGA